MKKELRIGVIGIVALALAFGLFRPLIQSGIRNWKETQRIAVVIGAIKRSAACDLLVVAQAREVGNGETTSQADLWLMVNINTTEGYVGVVDDEFQPHILRFSKLQDFTRVIGVMPNPDKESHIQNFCKKTEAIPV